MGKARLCGFRTRLVRSISLAAAGILAVSMGVPASAANNPIGRRVQASVEKMQLPSSAATNVTPSTARCSTSPVLSGNVGSYVSVLKQDGSVWSWGFNGQGQLGDGTTTNRSTPVQVVGPNGVGTLGGIASVVGGDYDTVAARSDGTVQAWGEGPLGDTAGYPSPTPVQVAGPSGSGYLTDMVTVAHGDTFFAALRGDGTVWMWGYGPLGNIAGFTYSATPVEVPGPDGTGALTGIVQIAAGTYHILALRSDGTVWAWGNNTYGELGTTQSTGNPAEVVGPNGTGALTGVVDISGGQRFSVALRNDGSVWSWGDNIQGQLGQGSTDSNTHATPAQVVGPGGIGFLTGASQVSATLEHAGAVKTDGTAWTWGWNGVGELGNGDATLQPSATPVQVVAPGGGYLTNVTRMTGGQDYGIAEKNDGTVWAWGDNYYGELGQGAADSNAHPVPAQVLGTGGNGVLTGVAQPTPCNTPQGSELYGGTPVDEEQTSASVGGYPVDGATGNFWHSFSDVLVPGRGIPLTFVRTYNSLCAVDPKCSTYDAALSPGWTFNYNVLLTFTNDTNGTLIKATVHEENGATVDFAWNGSSFQPLNRVVASLVKNQDGTYTLTRPNQTQLFFTAGGLLTKETDRNGYATVLSYSNGHLATVTDPETRSLTFAYYSNGQLQKVTDPAGRSVSFQYDANGNLQFATDLAGNLTQFGYQTNSLLTTMTDPRGGVLLNTYDPNNPGQVVQQVDPMNRVTKFSYSSGFTTITDPKGNVSYQEYQGNELFRLTLGVGTPQQASWTYTYDPAVLAVTSITDPAGNVWNNTWDKQGNLLTHTDPLQNKWTYTYYYPSNNLETALDPLLVKTTNHYDNNESGNIISTSTPLLGTSLSATTTYSYADSKHPGDLTSITDPDGKVWTYGYDGNGIRNKAVDPAGDTSTYSYDNVGRLDSSVSPKGNVVGGNPAAFTTTYTPDIFGRPVQIIDPLAHQTLFHYDGNGNLDRLTDANSHVTIYSYNADNELEDVQRADSSHLGTGYDADGNVASQTDGLKNTTTYTYDPLNRLASVTDPLKRSTTYQYDDMLEHVVITDPQGRTTSYFYNTADQLTGISYSDGVTPAVGFAYDPDGQRKTMTDGTGTSSYVIDSLHRLTSMTTGAGQTVNYGYDIKGQLTSITYPGGTQTVSRSYDAAGRLQSVTDWANHKTTYGYDPNSNATLVSYPNGTSATFGYDNADRLTSIVDAKGTANFLSLTYGVDAIGQASSENTTSYGYNAINQLTGAGTTTYGYDGADNLHQGMMPGLGALTLTSDPANQLATGSVRNGSSQVESMTFKYDPTGNRYQEVGTGAQAINNTYKYDQANRLTGYGASATYLYNGDGLRMTKTVAGATTQQSWDVAEGLPLLLKDGTTSYIAGLGGLPLEQITASGTTSYYHQDRLGSTRAITNVSGSVVATDTYDAYGYVTASTGTLVNPFQYAGQYTDSESGLQYDRARYYDPTTGGFLTRDAFANQTRQPYSYAGDSPVNALDPSGQGLLEAGQAAMGGALDLEVSAEAAVGQALAATAADWIGYEHDKLVSGNPLKVASGVLDVFASVFTLGAGGAEETTLERLAVSSGDASGIGSMKVLRTLSTQEDLNALVTDMNQATYETGLEHAVVRTGGELKLVSGGPTGIELSDSVEEVLLHTHPFPASGAPSADDIAMLERLGQESSWILSREGLTQFFRG